MGSDKVSHRSQALCLLLFLSQTKANIPKTFENKTL